MCAIKTPECECGSRGCHHSISEVSSHLDKHKMMLFNLVKDVCRTVRVTLLSLVKQKNKGRQINKKISTTMRDISMTMLAIALMEGTWFFST